MYVAIHLATQARRRRRTPRAQASPYLVDRLSDGELREQYGPLAELAKRFGQAVGVADVARLF